MEKTNKKSILSALAAGVAALTLICAGTYMAVPSDVTVHASVEDTEDTLKLFVGDIERAPDEYVQQRASYLEDLADTAASDTEVDAVIGLDDYYTVDDVIALTDKYGITVKRVYMWPEGETGRLGLYVENGNIKDGIKMYMEQVERNGLTDEQSIEDYQRFLDGEYGVFALTVTASADDLETLNAEASSISYIDVRGRRKVCVNDTL